jgi:hypothetical protein
MGTTLNYSILFPTTQGSSLLNALFSATDSAATANPLPALQQAERDQTKDIALEAADPVVSRDVTAFRNAVASAKTPADLLKDPSALKVLLTANGLGDQVQYTALAQQALLSDTSNTNSLAVTLPNANWKTAAQTYDFYNQGLSVIQQPSVLDSIANAYAEVTWRQSLDTTTPGLSNALTFRSEASTITSVDQILGDPVLRDVVTTALGLPLQIAVQPLMTQEKAITSRLDITKFSDPKFTESFIQRYLIAKAASSTSSTSSSSLIA